MQYLGNHRFELFDQTEWLQDIVQTVALGEDVPISVTSYSLFKQLPDLLNERYLEINPASPPLFPNRESFDNFVVSVLTAVREIHDLRGYSNTSLKKYSVFLQNTWSSSVSILPYVERRLWYTYPTNPISLNTALKFDDSWRTLIIITCYAHIAMRSSFSITSSIINTEVFLTEFVQLEIGDTKLSCVFGPIIKSKDHDNLNAVSDDLAELHRLFTRIIEITNNSDHYVPTRNLSDFIEGRFQTLLEPNLVRANYTISTFQGRIKSAISALKLSIDLLTSYKSLQLSSEQIADITSSCLFFTRSGKDIINTFLSSRIWPLRARHLVFTCSILHNKNYQLAVEVNRKGAITTKIITSSGITNKYSSHWPKDSVTKISVDLGQHWVSPSQRNRNLSNLQLTFERLTGLRLRIRDRRANGVSAKLQIIQSFLNFSFGELDFANGTPDDREATINTREKINYICRLICEMINADISTLYFYAFDTESLQSVEAFFTDFALRQNSWRSMARHKRNINPIIKHLSLGYRACGFGLTSSGLQTWSELDSKQLYVSEPSTTHYKQVLLSPKELQVKSAVATPLYFKSRLLGVFEVKGLKINQFDAEQRFMLNQLANSIGPVLYQNNLLSFLQQINDSAFRIRVASSETETHIELNKICRTICSIFLCHSSSFWLAERKHGRNLLYLRGAHNQSNLLDVIKKEPDFYSIDPIKDKSSLPAKILNARSSDTEKFFGTDQEYFEEHELPIFKDTAWISQKSHRKILGLSGVNSMSSLLLFDNSAHLIGSVSLYHKDTPNYNGWHSLAFFIQKYLVLMLETLNLWRKSTESVRLRIVHEATGAAKYIRDRVERVEEVTNTLLVPNLRTGFDKSEWQSKFNLAYIDINTEIKRLAFLAEDFNRIITNRPIQPVREDKLAIRNAVNWALQNDNLLFRQKRILLDFKPDSNVSIIFSKDELHTVLRNIVENAAKYSIPGSSFSIRYNIDDGGMLYLHFSNTAPKLKPGEQYRIKDKFFRGSHAIKSGSNGEGNGLFIIDEILKKYSGHLIYSDHPINSADTTSLVIHRFTIRFHYDRVERL